MPPKPFKPPRSSTTTSRKSTPSKPGPKPNPKSATSISAKPKASASRLSNFSLPSLSPDSVARDDPDEQEEDGSDPFTSDIESRPRSRTAQEQREGEVEDEPERQEIIPEDLLSVLLHEFFKDAGGGATRMTRDANKAVGKYMDTFVREALARAAWAREEGGGMDMDARGGFLEVEDLEKLAPQLLLDF